MKPPRTHASAAGLALLLAAGPAAATAGSTFPAAFEEAAETAKAMLVPPGYEPSGRDDRGRDCVDLYNERLALLPYIQDYRKPFYDDPRNTVAGAVGVVFAPAFLYWGYSAFADVEAERRKQEARTRIDELTYALARLHCWEW